MFGPAYFLFSNLAENIDLLHLLTSVISSYKPFIIVQQIFITKSMRYLISYLWKRMEDAYKHVKKST